MSKPCVFIVDDEDVIRRGIVKRLTRHHFNVRDFNSGEALLNFMDSQNEAPDVLLLDFKMPGMNGLETLKEVHKKNPSVSAVVLTAYEGAVNIEAAKTLGVCEVFTKTLELDGLVHIVNGALAIRKLQKNHQLKYDSNHPNDLKS